MEYRIQSLRRSARHAHPVQPCKPMDREAAEYWITRNRNLVYALARRYFPRLSRDEDLLQCGLIGMWEAASRWEGTGSLTALARRCILNNMHDYLRAEQNAPSPCPQPEPEAYAEFEEETIDRLDMLERICGAWPENSRERYVLIALSNGVSKHAVAAALGVEMHTLRRIARRAMRGLPPREPE